MENKKELKNIVWDKFNSYFYDIAFNIVFGFMYVLVVCGDELIIKNCEIDKNMELNLGT